MKFGGGVGVPGGCSRAFPGGARLVFFSKRVKKIQQLCVSEAFMGLLGCVLGLGYFE